MLVNPIVYAETNATLAGSYTFNDPTELAAFTPYYVSSNDFNNGQLLLRDTQTNTYHDAGILSKASYAGDLDVILQFTGHSLFAPDAYQGLLELIHNLFKSKDKNAKLTICRQLLIKRSQFFHNRRHFSNQANERSTIQRLGNTLKVWRSLRLTTSTSAPARTLATPLAKGLPV